MQSIPVSTCRLTVSAMAGVTCAAMTAGSVISALASRPGMSSQPLGGGSRPTCEVLIRVMLRCIFLSFPVPTCDLRMIYDDSDRTGSLAIADTLTVDDLGRDLCDEFEASGG